MSRGLYKSPAAPPSTIPPPAFDYDPPAFDYDPPAFDYDEMLFSVSIRDGSGKEIISEVLCGDQLDTLKQYGAAAVVLEQPIIIGTYHAAPVAAYVRYAERDAKCDNWSAAVHLFRLDQNKCCCFHESGSCDWRTFTTNFPFTHTTAAGALVGWANSSSKHSGTLELDRHYVGHGDASHFQGIQFDVNLKCRVQRQAPPRPADPSVATVVLEIGKVHLMAILVDTDGGRGEFMDADFDHGITLPHLFDHLKGWGYPDD
jgi:hypothetical protein